MDGYIPASLTQIGRAVSAPRLAARARAAGLVACFAACIWMIDVAPVLFSAALAASVAIAWCLRLERY